MAHHPPRDTLYPETNKEEQMPDIATPAQTPTVADRSFAMKLLLSRMTD
jgi:hypothetical protein